MQTVTCNVECSYVHEYFQYMITPYTDFDQGGEGKYSEFQVTGTGMIEGFFLGGGTGGGRGEGGVGKVENFDGGIFWAGKFGKYFPLGAWLDSSRDFWVLVSQVLLEWLPDVEK